LQPSGAFLQQCDQYTLQYKLDRGAEGLGLPSFAEIRAGNLRNFNLRKGSGTVA